MTRINLGQFMDAVRALVAIAGRINTGIPVYHDVSLGGSIRHMDITPSSKKPIPVSIHVVVHGASWEGKAFFGLRSYLESLGFTLECANGRDEKGATVRYSADLDPGLWLTLNKKVADA